MHKSMVPYTPFLRIGGDIGQLVCEIPCITNAMLMEPRLPELPPKLGSHRMRKAAFNALCASFDRLALRGSKQNVDVLGHHHESMQKITTFVPVMEERAHQQFGVCRSSEQ